MVDLENPEGATSPQGEHAGHRGCRCLARGDQVVWQECFTLVCVVPVTCLAAAVCLLIYSQAGDKSIKANWLLVWGGMFLLAASVVTASPSVQCAIWCIRHRHRSRPI